MVELAVGGVAARFAAYWFLLDAFHIGGSVRNVLLVLGVQVVAMLVPFTPGGAGVQQALLLTVFAGAASASRGGGVLGRAADRARGGRGRRWASARSC